MELEPFKFWVKALMNSLDTQVDKETAQRILEECGRACARKCGSPGVVEDIKREAGNNGDIDELLRLMNARGLAGGKLQRANNTISGVYEDSLCPVLGEAQSPMFYYCTCGWTKEVFERLLERPVVVEAKKVEISGDEEVCKFIVTY